MKPAPSQTSDSSPPQPSVANSQSMFRTSYDAAFWTMIKDGDNLVAHAAATAQPPPPPPSRPKPEQDSVSRNEEQDQANN